MITKRRRTAKSIRRISAKAYSAENILKSVSTLRKSLIEANRQALLSMDEIEDACYSAAPIAGMSSETANSQLKSSIASLKELSGCVEKAIALSEKIKKTVRGTSTISATSETEPVDVAGEIANDEAAVASLRYLAARRLRRRYGR